MTRAAPKVTTERALAEGTRSGWQGSDTAKVTLTGHPPCLSDRVARRIATGTGGSDQ